MTIWVDVHLSPAIARWISANFPFEAVAVRDMAMGRAKDHAIFMTARSANAIVLTKDFDFVDLLSKHGPPPKVIWLTCGNTSNARLQEILQLTLALAVQRLEAGAPLVEIADGY